MRSQSGVTVKTIDLKVKRLWTLEPTLDELHIIDFLHCKYWKRIRSFWRRLHRKRGRLPSLCIHLHQSIAFFQLCSRQPYKKSLSWFQYSDHGKSLSQFVDRQFYEKSILEWMKEWNEYQNESSIHLSFWTYHGFRNVVENGGKIIISVFKMVSNV